ncbi:MAG: type II toxin-antitoxin system prevent-host-death family antitoxin [Nitrospinae bacterium]|nr:type II toxin-antitoxin system prevent-host-death family antitoxin [Nitrospinota bacterium]
MIRKATAMIVRQNLGELLNEVRYRGDSVLVTKGGKPVAALIDIELFEKISVMRAAFDRMVSGLSSAFQDADEQAVMEDIAKAVKAARKR